MGKAISLRVQNLGQNPKVVKQIETPHPPDPIMRRPRAEREEKRVTHGATPAGEVEAGRPECRATNRVRFRDNLGETLWW
ncbi:hypothetical protein ACFONL_09100, partial [Camelimonas fluminis]